MSVLLWPSPQDCEGPRSFTMRVAQANLLSFGSVDGAIFSHAGTQSEQRVLERWNALKHAPSLWVHRRARWCPGCLANTEYGRLGWELLFADACTLCGHWLADVCLECGGAVTWSRACLDRCKCGALLTEQTSSLAPLAVRRLAMSLEQLCLGKKETEIAQLSELSPLQCTKLIRLIGAYGGPDIERAPQKIMRADQLAVSWRVSTAAAEVLADWPSKFYRFLELQSSRSLNCEQSRRMTGVFGGFYRVLYQGLRGSEFDWVRTAFEVFITHSWTGAMGRRNRRMPVALQERLSWMPLASAMSSGSFSKQSIVDLANAGTVQISRKKTLSGREFVMVRRVDIEALPKDRQRDMSLVEASIHLGIKRQRLSRWLPSICPSARKSTLAGTPWLIPNDWVQAWIARINDVKSINGFSPSSTSLGRLLRYGPLGDDRLVHLLIDLEQGKLFAIGRDPKQSGLASLLFNQAEVLARYGTPSKCIMTIPNAAKYLGVKQEVGYALARLSLLETSPTVVGRRTARGVSTGAIEKFETEYVFATALAQSKGCSSATIADALTRKGIEPVASRRVGNCRQIVYRRADLLSVGWV